MIITGEISERLRRINSTTFGGEDAEFWKKPGTGRLLRLESLKICQARPLQLHKIDSLYNSFEPQFTVTV
jgi:hypothetical protein